MRTSIGHTRGQRSRISCVQLAACERDVGVPENGQVLVAVFEAVGQEAESGAVLYAAWSVSSALDIQNWVSVWQGLEEFVAQELLAQELYI